MDRHYEALPAWWLGVMPMIPGVSFFSQTGQGSELVRSWAGRLEILLTSWLVCIDQHQDAGVVEVRQDLSSSSSSVARLEHLNFQQ